MRWSFVTRGILCQTQGSYLMDLEDLEATEVDMAGEIEEDTRKDSLIGKPQDHLKLDELAQLRRGNLDVMDLLGGGSQRTIQLVNDY